MLFFIDRPKKNEKEKNSQNELNTKRVNLET